MAKAKKSTWAVLVALGAVVAVVAAVVLLSGGEADARQFATLQVIEGQVDVSKGGGAFASGSDGQSLAAGDVVRTSSDGLAEITYFDESLTRLGPDTVFTIEELATLDNDAKSKRIRGSHDRGRTWNRVTELADSQSRFEIETPVATAAVRGTVFATDCDFFGDCTYVSIEDTIEVCDGDECVTLDAFDVVVVNSDGTFGEVVHFDSLEELVAAFPWVNDNACDIEDLLSCEDQPEPEPSPSPSASPEPSPTGTTEPEDVEEDPADGETPPAPSANAAPDASFAPSASSGAAPLAVSFDNTSSDPDGDALTYVWDFGDGSALSTAAEPSHDFGAGTWTVSLTARDGDGATDTASATVVASDLTAPSAPVITSPGPGATVGANPVVFTGDAEEGSTVTIFDGGTSVGTDVANSPFEVPVSLDDGVHLITATATDAAGNESLPSLALTITVDAVNLPPVGEGDELSTGEDAAGSVNVLANDNDPDGDTLSVQSVGDPANGSVVNVGDGTVIYTPDLNVSGTDSFDYTVADGRGGTDVATVSVTVGAVNDAPAASLAADPAAGTVPLDVTFTPGGSDAEGLTSWVLDFGDGEGEVLAALSVDGDWPPPATIEHTYSDPGTYTATLTVTDSDGAVAEASQQITVDEPPNTAPDAVDDDGASTSEDTPVTIDVLDNDSDPQNDALTVTSVSDPANGSTAIVTGGVAYTPDANFFGVDTFTYTAQDPGGLSDSATVTVTVSAADDEGSASLSADPTSGDAPLPVTFTINGSDVDGLVSYTLDFGDEVTVIDGPLELEGPSPWPTETPFNAEHTYENPGSYTALLTVTDALGNTSTATAEITTLSPPPPENHAPNADNDTAVNNGEPVTIDVLANDEDPDAGDSIFIASFNQAIEGTVSEGETFGTLVYTPDGGYSGTDAFSYTIQDQGGLEDTATVTLSATADAVTIVLQWTGPRGRDLDLHVWTPGDAQHVYYGNPCLSTGAGCWATLDHDVTNGPPASGSSAVETITLFPAVAGYVAGTYRVYVDNFSCGEHTFNNTGVTVTINTASASQTFALPDTNPHLRQWNVATVGLDGGGAGSPSATGTIVGAQCHDPDAVALTAAADDDEREGRRDRDRRMDRRARLERRERREAREDRQERREGRDAPASAESVTGLRATSRADGVRLDWDGGTNGVARYSTTAFPRSVNDGRAGCTGAGRCDIRGLAAGTRLYVTVFATNERTARPVRGVNAVETALPAAPAEPVPAPEAAPVVEVAPAEPAPVAAPARDRRPARSDARHDRRAGKRR